MLRDEHGGSQNVAARAVVCGKIRAMIAACLAAVAVAVFFVA